jgi:endoglucanase
MTITTNHVVEICMALPDVICLVVRDAECVPQSLLNLGSPHASALDAWVQADRETGGAGTDWAKVIGANDFAKEYLIFMGEVPAERVDRAAVDDPSNYPTIGGCTVTAVYRKSKPYDQTDWYNAGNKSYTSSFEHKIFLQLDDDLPQGGPYSISVDGDTFPATDFTFDDTVTRAIGLQVNQAGYRPEDERKIADFILWIPGYGTEGRTSLALDTAELIDSQGATVTDFDDLAITLFTDATTAVTGQTNRTYASTTAVKTATDVTEGNPTTITIAGHGYGAPASTSTKSFLGFGGTSSILGSITITVVDADTFTIPINTTSQTWVSGTYLSDFDSKVYDTFTANYYATNVYRIDFSTFVPTTYQGEFRVRIPGLGVSDPFQINDAVRYDAATVHAKGYYNQLTGIALDADVGGWERPVDFVDGVNGVEVYESIVPAGFVTDAGVQGTSVADAYKISNTLVRSTYGTSNRVAWVGPTVRDAGDWDWHMARHADMAHALVEYAYRILPEDSRDFDTGFPKATTFCDPVLYAGTDYMGSAVHMAVAELDAIRKLQPVGGGVYSGMQWGVSGIGPDGNNVIQEPSFISRYEPALLAADPTHSYHYVIGAAKLGQVFLEAGLTTLGNTWLDSAVLEWEWAENIYQDYLANGATGLEVDAWGSDFYTAAGWSAPTWAAATADLFGSVTEVEQWRRFAQATLYAVTDDQDLYGDEVAASGTGGLNASGTTGLAGWEFVQAPSSTEYLTGMGANLRNAVIGQFTDLSPNVWGDWKLFIWDAFAGGTPTHASASIKLMENYLDIRAGVQNEGMSWTTGLGVRGPINTLLRDREWMGIPGPDIPGVSVYFNFTLSSSFIAPNNFALGNSNANYTFIAPSDSGALGRTIEPTQRHTPIMECYYDNTYVIYSTEHTTQERALPFFILAAILHAFDENTATTAVKRIRRQVVVTT